MVFILCVPINPIEIPFHDILDNSGLPGAHLFVNFLNGPRLFDSFLHSPPNTRVEKGRRMERQEEAANRMGGLFSPSVVGRWLLNPASKYCVVTDPPFQLKHVTCIPQGPGIASLLDLRGCPWQVGGRTALLCVVLGGGSPRCVSQL